MPSFIVKPERGIDFYVLWSTVVDAPIAWGSRQELSEAGDGFRGDKTYAHDRFERADHNGTSMQDGSWFGWDDETIIVMNMPKDGILRRINLRKYLDSIVIENGAAVSADDSLIEPFED
jgi:hypothetical protein